MYQSLAGITASLGTLGARSCSAKVASTAIRIRIKLIIDPYNANKPVEEPLNIKGIPVDYLRQGYLSVSDPPTTLHELILGRKLRHGGHSILRWHASSAVVRSDAVGDIKLDKEKSRRKIVGLRRS
jgi:phage terminase large subunit-like protein